jgi:hypothetical protein
MLSNLVAGFVLSVFVLSVVFVFFGKSIIMLLPIIRRLKVDKTELGSVALIKAISKGTTFAVLCSRLLTDFVDNAAHQDLRNYLHRSIGDVVGIVHYRERSLRRIIRELQLYAFLVAMLGVVGLLKSLHKAGFEFHEVWKAVGDDPFQLLALFELIVLLFFSFRLIVELASIKELLED